MRPIEDFPLVLNVDGLQQRVISELDTGPGCIILDVVAMWYLYGEVFSNRDGDRRICICSSCVPLFFLVVFLILDRDSVCPVLNVRSQDNLMIFIVRQKPLDYFFIFHFLGKLWFRLRVILSKTHLFEAPS